MLLGSKPANESGDKQDLRMTPPAFSCDILADFATSAYFRADNHSGATSETIGHEVSPHNERYNFHAAAADLRVRLHIAELSFVSGACCLDHIVVLAVHKSSYKHNALRHLANIVSRSRINMCRFRARLRFQEYARRSSQRTYIQLHIRVCRCGKYIDTPEKEQPLTEVIAQPSTISLVRWLGTGLGPIATLHCGSPTCVKRDPN